jgi:hypothetical protein
LHGWKRAPARRSHQPNPTHAPSSLQNIRLSSYVANPLRRSRNWQADGDGCVGSHLDAGVGYNGCTVGSERARIVERSHPACRKPVRRSFRFNSETAALQCGRPVSIVPPFTRPDTWTRPPSRVSNGLSPRTPNPTHAPSSLQNIRLSSYVANPLRRSRNWQADGDGCVGSHLDAGVGYNGSHGWKRALVRIVERSHPDCRKLARCSLRFNRVTLPQGRAQPLLARSSVSAEMRLTR